MYEFTLGLGKSQSNLAYKEVFIKGLYLILIMKKFNFKSCNFLEKLKYLVYYL